MPEPQPDMQRSLLALFRRDGTIALRREADARYGLPFIELEENSRPAQALTTSLRHHLDVDAVYLWNLPVVDDGDHQVHVAELRGAGALPADWQWADAGNPGPIGLTYAETLAVQRAHQIATTYSSDYPYAQLGWFDQLLEWTRNSLHDGGLSLTGQWAQVNGGRAFLVRLETDRSGVWFKAPGAPSQFEWHISLKLAAAAPEWLPRILDVHPGWKGWLSEEVGESLYRADNFEHFNLAAKALGRFQRELQGRSDWLFSIGVHDQRLPWLRSRIKPFQNLVSALMALQPKEPPLVLTETQICHLGEQLDHAITSLEQLDFPDSIIHGDISPGSIVCDGRRCAFIDWSRAYVGFPPVCCELMLNKFTALLSGRDIWRPQLWNTYFDQWPEYATAFDSGHLRRSLALVSLLSYVVTKIDIDQWQSAPLQSAGGYLRSLARRMFAVAQEMRQGRVEVYQHA
jgi:hypothetical protein